MAPYELDLDLTTALATPRRCPRCASDQLEPTAREGIVTFRCRQCRRRWASELGTLVAKSEPRDERAPEARRSVPPQETGPS